VAKHQNKNQNKSVVEKIAAAVDHVIHPEAAPKSEPEKVEAGQPSYKEHQAAWESKKELAEKSRELRSRKEVQDFEQHPKFSKFKKGVN
jgi:hypothetical protein